MTPLTLVWLLAVLPPAVHRAADDAKRAAVVRAAVERALPPLVAGAAGHAERKTCFACHNQTFPAMAFAAARSRGVPVAANVLPAQAEHVVAFLTDNRDKFTSGQGTGGQVDTAGSALLALEFAGHKADADTTAVVEYLLKTQPDRDHWRTSSNRPPSEASGFTATYLAARGVRQWADAGQKPRADKRVESARGWLTRTPAADTEDRVFRLFGLAEVGATEAAVAAAAWDLLSKQQGDGGWSQRADMAADPYATGTALVALHRAGKLATDHPAYRRGVDFLVTSQRSDGTWRVRSRSKPFQPYYESGFPHGPHQFISATASGWAATALALALPGR